MKNKMSRDMAYVVLGVVLVTVFLMPNILHSKGNYMKVDDVKKYLIEPPYKDWDIFDEENSFQFNSDHMTFIRKSVLSWDDIERGAPKLDPLKPFGADDLFGQLNLYSHKEASDQEKAQFYVSMTKALNHFISNATLQPGDYKVSNLTIKEIKKEMAGYSLEGSTLSGFDLGFTDTGKVRISADMIVLVKSAYWEWSDSWDNEELIEDSLWPSPAIDPKRPYGDSSYIEYDMHQILQWPIQSYNEEGFAELTDDQKMQLALMHFRLLTATQAFLEHAELK